MRSVRGWFALLAAFLFGISTPAAKFLVGKIDPLMLASLLYLGAGVGLAIYLTVSAWTGFKVERHFRFKNRFEAACFVGVIVSGGILGPVLLMFGLTRTSASAASLLLNLEAAFTALLAVYIFHEHYGRRLVAGLLLIILGGVLLAWFEQESVAGSIPGMLAIIGACACWAVDNNLTREVASVGAAPLAAVKGIVAGGANLMLALAVGRKVPHAGLVCGAMVIGFFGYGLSLVFYIFSLRRIGAARSSAYFSTAPFVGAIVSVLMLGERVTVPLLAAGGLMGIGVWVHLSEKMTDDG